VTLRKAWAACQVGPGAWLCEVTGTMSSTRHSLADSGILSRSPSGSELRWSHRRPAVRRSDLPASSDMSYSLAVLLTPNHWPGHGLPAGRARAWNWDSELASEPSLNVSSFPSTPWLDVSSASPLTRSLNLTPSRKSKSDRRLSRLGPADSHRRASGTLVPYDIIVWTMIS
jgi:hypothetical protein